MRGSIAGTICRLARDEVAYGNFPMKRFAGVLALLTGLILAQSAAVGAEGHGCARVVDAQLSYRGIPADDMSSVSYDVLTGAFGSGPTLLAWVRLKSCKGYAVIEMHTDCDFIQAYTLGDCRIDRTPKG